MNATVPDKIGEMKNWLYALVVWILPFEALAQFAKVVDADGYVNVRESANSTSKVVARVKAGGFVYISDKGEENKSWAHISYDNAREGQPSEYISGYIHHSRLKSISAFPLIPAIAVDEEKATFSCCGVEVVIKSEKFDLQKNKQYFRKYDGYYTYKGKFALGALGIFPPRTSYQSISGSVENNLFQISRTRIENLFGVNNDASECHYDGATKTLFIVLNNSDGSDAYSALLVIEKGKYKVLINGDN